jgi:hypothetical protein
MRYCGRRSIVIALALITLASLIPSAFPQATPTTSVQPEYVWYEAENMRGFATQPNGEPVLNSSWMNPMKAQAPGWGMNGTGTSAEWSQGGGSEWNSAAASADETQGAIYQDIEVPRAGEYKVWVRYADWANKTENFVFTVTQGGRETFRQEFGARDIIDAHDEQSMYWGWAFTWDSAPAKLEKGPARISIGLEKAAQARRHVDSVLLTNDLAYVPAGRSKPDFAAMRYLREWSSQRPKLPSLIKARHPDEVPAGWQLPKVAGRDFIMPWNIAPEFWTLYNQPPETRPLYPFHAEPIEQFVEKYKGASAVPIFGSKLVLPVIYINSLPEYLKEGSAFLRYLRETKVPFAVLINYGSAQMSAEEGQAAWKLLNGELKDQFIGWISGESIGHVWGSAASQLKVLPSMTRKELRTAHHTFYTNAMAQKWAALFHTQTGAMWDKLIPAQSTSSTSYAHTLGEWGVNLLGMESAAVQPMFGMRMAFTRGGARQYGGAFLYYHAPNFGDTATTFTKLQNFAGPDNFFHSRYGATMGPSLSWYRKSYYYSYMAGASAIYLEQGGDQFFKPGPGEHEFQLNPLGRITDEFMRFAERYPNRGTPYTPIAFLLDPAHGWDMTDYPQWPFGVSQINRGDRTLRELFGVAYYPGLVVEGEPATGDRQAFVNGIFGDVFDVLVASEVQSPTSSVPGAKSDVQRQTSRVQSQNSSSAQKRQTTKANDWDYEGSKIAELPSSGSSVQPVSGAALQTPSVMPVSRPPVLPLESYRAIVVGGHIDWTTAWIQKLTEYLKSGGVVVLNAAQVKGLPEDLLGVKLMGKSVESDTARCLAPGEPPQTLSGQMFRYEKVELKLAWPLITSGLGDPLVTTNRVGKGSIIFSTLPDLLGEDERITPFAAHLLAHIFDDATPITIRGDVEYLLNRTEGGWIVTLFNNKGVNKPAQGMAQVDRTAYVSVTISLQDEQIQNAVEWISEKSVAVKNLAGKSGVSVSIAPGGVAVVELKTR